MYPLSKEFFCRARFAIIVNVLEHKYTFICARAMIVLPCLLISLLLVSCDKKSESFNSGSLCREITFENGINLVHTLPLSQVVFCESRGENGSQFSASNNFVVFLRDSQGKTISNPSAQKCPDDKESPSYVSKFEGSRVQFYLSLLLGGIAGAIIGSAMLLIIFFFIQR